MELFGYAGKILHLNLSENRLQKMPLERSLTKEFLGGSGFATKFFIDLMDPHVEPLSPKNVIAIMTGPLTGTMAPMNGRHIIVSKSPLTHAWGQSDSGGHWGAELKFAGFDGIIVEGAAEEPTYLWVSDGNAELLSAKEIWGLDTFETEHFLKQKHGRKTKVLCIGQAGENLVKFSAVMNDKGRAAGRRGLGAVMGSKKLKAIAVSGSNAINVHDDKMLLEISKEIVSQLKKNPRVNTISEFGTGANIPFLLKIKDLPIKNWLQDDLGDELNSLNKQVMRETLFVGSRACYGCPVGCEKTVLVSEGPYSMKESGRGPEYEAIASMGSLCLNFNLKAIAKANDLANRYGVDAITAGCMIAFTMEIFERGIISEKELGFKAEWGDPEVVINLIEMIARRRGFGNILAEGPKGAAKIIGRNSEAYAPNVKGESVPMHDPRTYLGKALMYAVCPYGPDHSRGSVAELYTGSEELGIEKVDEPTTRDVARAFSSTENFVEVLECMMLCTFQYASYAGGISPAYVPKLYNSVTGDKISLDDMLKIGSKLVQLKRDFNERAGLKAEDDNLPPRFREVPRYVNGKAVTVDYKPYVEEYYKIRGWKG
jgi:aldehyde:ferredoxin oxidoreductase